MSYALFIIRPSFSNHCYYPLKKREINKNILFLSSSPPPPPPLVLLAKSLVLDGVTADAAAVVGLLLPYAATSYDIAAQRTRR